MNDTLPAEPMGDYLADAVRKQTRTLTSKLAEYRGNASPDIVHEARIAARRLRTYLSLAGCGTKIKGRRKIGKRLKSLCAKLGAIRNLDVVLDDARRHAKKLTAGRRQAAFVFFVSALERQREAAAEKLWNRIDPEKIDALETLPESLTERARGRGRGCPPRTARLDASVAAASAYADLMAYEPSAFGGAAGAEIYHAVRKAAKRLRYVLELYESALGPETAGLIAETKKLQDHLGKLNDVFTASGICESFISGSLAPESGPFLEASRYLAARRAQEKRLVAKLPLVWKKIASSVFRKRLFRILAA